MKKILKVAKPEDFCSYIGAECRHPLVAVIDFEKVSPIPSSLNRYDVYGLFMHSKVRDDLTYGLSRFGNESGTLICVAPGQIGGRESKEDFIDIDGWALLFHPQLIRGTHLEKEIKKFSFFDYSANEALFMDEEERKILISVMRNIQMEIDSFTDADQNGIIVGYISALLHYCNRFYHRQFNSIRRNSDDILVRFSLLLDEYFDNGTQLTDGIPSVQYFADKLCMSPSYFSDMLKKTTGENASNFIRSHIMRIAKNKLIVSGNVADVAYSLGFEYPQHFTRMFKRHTGMTPTQYLGKQQV
ncbi:MAG: helix-turn-helix domain-containing protein [Bacteroides sp.]|nr:helix-turn-helix domain-containing protein [Roseburia sp.]MCM1346558.1 helix-turn-helix domain-containing protein [Bacteroides sp.]MCM1420564.1 helix-turn-helix domain-containing protein [Bacteroides sp.]